MTAPDRPRCYTCLEPMLSFEGLVLADWPKAGPARERILCRGCSEAVNATVEQTRAWYLRKQAERSSVHAEPRGLTERGAVPCVPWFGDNR